MPSVVTVLAGPIEEVYVLCIVKESYHHGKLSDRLALGTREEFYVEEVSSPLLTAIRNDRIVSHDKKKTATQLVDLCYHTSKNRMSAPRGQEQHSFVMPSLSKTIRTLLFGGAANR